MLAFRLSTLLFLQFAIQGAWVPVLALHLKGLGIAPLDAAWIFATSSLGNLLAPLVWSQIADRWLSAEKCISLCTLVAGTMLWIVASAHGPGLLFWGFFGYWMFQVPSLSLSYALVFRHLEHPERDYSKIRLWGTVGWIAASLMLSAWLSMSAAEAQASPHESLGETATNHERDAIHAPDTYVAAFRWGAILGWMLAAYGLTLPPTPPCESPTRGVTTGALGVLRKLVDAPLRAVTLFRQPSFAVYCFCVFGVFVTWPFNLQMMPLELRALGVPRPWLPTVQTIAQSFEVVTMGLLPMFLLRLELKKTMVLGIVCYLAALGVLTLAGPLWLVLGSLALHGFFITCFLVAGQVFVHSLAEADYRASVQGLNVVINGAGMLLGNMLVGAIRERVGDDFTRAFLPATITIAALAVLFMLTFRTAATRPDRVG